MKSERILVGIYTRNGKVVTHGWQKTTDVDAVDLGHRMYAIGVRHVVYTDISRDGTLSGINIKEAAQLGDLTSLRVIASGGLADLYDLDDSKRMNITTLPAQL
ncbi:MAG: HisA/HisF-related TIM barrel protein [Caldilineaceae bacterium]